MRENEKAHHMSVLKQQAYDTAMERIRDKVGDLITVFRYTFSLFTFVSLYHSFFLFSLAHSKMSLLPPSFLTFIVSFFCPFIFYPLSISMSLTLLTPLYVALKYYYSCTYCYLHNVLLLTHRTCYSDISKSLLKKEVSMKDSGNLADDPEFGSRILCLDRNFIIS